MKLNTSEMLISYLVSEVEREFHHIAWYLLKLKIDQSKYVELFTLAFVHGVAAVATRTESVDGQRRNLMLKKTIDITLTTDEVARQFLDMDVQQHADFFQTLATLVVDNCRPTRFWTAKDWWFAVGRELRQRKAQPACAMIEALGVGIADPDTRHESRCDTCGAPATHVAQDLTSEPDPISCVLRRRAVGVARYGCDLHKVDSIDFVR